MQPYVQSDFKIKDNWTVVDIGANVGIFSTYAVKQAKDVKVFAYEPESSNFEYLIDNITRNNLSKNIKPFKLAVTRQPNKQLTLYIHAYGSGGNSLFVEQVSKKHTTQTVKTTSLSQILKNNNISKIDLLKLDCEGAEYDILLNATKNTLSKIKRIVLESHKIKGYSISDIEKFLQESGFNTYYNIKGVFCAEAIK
jgi:FkbM family methyltransferase